MAPGHGPTAAPFPCISIDSARLRWRAEFCLVRRWHVALKPVDRPLHYVPSMRWIDEPMPLIGIHHQLSCDFVVAQRMPELIRLWRRALSIAITHHNQGWRARLLDKVDGRALGIHRWIVIDRRPKIWNHPLVDRVLPVVALPV